MILATRLCQQARLSSNKDILKDMFKGAMLKTDATELCLCLAILYRDGYCCFSGLFPIYLYSQNLVFSLLLRSNVQNPRKYSFIFIRPAQNWESPDFLCICPMGLFCMHIFHSKSCQMPFSLISCTNIYPINIDVEHQCS
jgi:hypothetical protein